MRERDYTYYRGGKTGYMGEVVRYFKSRHSTEMHILDVPSGSGIFARELQAMGHQVTKADIHNEEDSVYANMESEMPFSDAAFDAVTCLEGVEHVLDPVFLIRELVRITKPGGTIVISTPNAANLHSRLQFLFTGTFFQFDARGMRQTYGNAVDRGHVSPFTPLHLIYVLGAVGCNLVEVRTDRWKRKALLPLRLLMTPVTFFWTRKISKGLDALTYPGVDNVHALLTSFKLMFGRSQILIFQKQ